MGEGISHDRDRSLTNPPVHHESADIMHWKVKAITKSGKTVHCSQGLLSAALQLTLPRENLGTLMGPHMTFHNLVMLKQSHRAFQVSYRFQTLVYKLLTPHPSILSKK
jgi:hypothetical protein